MRVILFGLSTSALGRPRRASSVRLPPRGAFNQYTMPCEVAASARPVPREILTGRSPSIGLPLLEEPSIVGHYKTYLSMTDHS